MNYTNTLIAVKTYANNVMCRALESEALFNLAVFQSVVQ